MHKNASVLFIGILIVLSFSCSLDRMVMKRVSRALAETGGGTAFTGDEDPELIGDALPFALKIFDALLESDPDNPHLLLAASSGYVSYANAFLHSPAEMIGYDRFEEQQFLLSRAKGLYRRGRDYGLRALENRNRGFMEELRAGNYDSALKDMEKGDIDFLYWTAAGWLGLIAVDSFDMANLLQAPRAVALAARGLQLDESYARGAFHELFISLNGGLPQELMYRTNIPREDDWVRKFLQSFYESMSADGATPEKRARFHLQRAVELSGDTKASPYVAFASSFPVQNQDIDEFTALLAKALEIDIDRSPEDRLVNVITKRKAEWLLQNIEDFFLPFDYDEAYDHDELFDE